MKKLLFTMAALLLLALPSSAMSYEQARQQALFLTDKMAYELNLSEAQYEAAYEINLDYLMSINTVDDLAGNYWRWRNLDMSYVLLEWQYRAFCDAAYFYRPLYWDTGCWHFAIYARYPHRDYYYFGRPTFYGVYRGDHAWHHNGGRSWYHGRHYGGPGPRGGMRDGFGRGDFGHGYRYRDGHMVAGNQHDRPSFGSQTDRPSYGGQDHRPYNGSQPYGPQRREDTTAAASMVPPRAFSALLPVRRAPSVVPDPTPVSRVPPSLRRPVPLAPRRAVRVVAAPVVAATLADPTDPLADTAKESSPVHTNATYDPKT